MILCSLFTCLIIVGAWIKIPVPVVPFTLQVTFTTLAGMLLGPNLGALSCLLYIALGLLGVPVFTAGGGIGYVFQPTFGYLIGFAIGAYVTGKITFQSPQPTVQRLIVAGLAGLFFVYLCGLLYMPLILKFVNGVPVDFSKILLYGLLLPLPGDLVLCVLSAVVVHRIQYAVKK